jgi:hypothetical protein
MWGKRKNEYIEVKPVPSPIQGLVSTGKSVSRHDTTPLSRVIVSTYQLISHIFGEVPGRRREVKKERERSAAQYPQDSGSKGNKVPMCREVDGLPMMV